MFPFPSFVPFNNVVTISFRATYVSSSTLTTYSFMACDLGTAAANRKIVVGIKDGIGNAVTISSVTIGGISASQVAVVTSSGDTTAIWQADVPTGTTGDIVVTFSGANSRCGIAVYAVYGAAAAAHATATSIATPLSTSIDVPAGGILIGVAGSRNAGSTWIWTNLIEDYDQSLSTSSFTGASDAFASLQTALTVTCANSGSTTVPQMVLASFGPR